MGAKERTEWAKIIAFLLAILPLILKYFVSGDDDNE